MKSPFHSPEYTPVDQLPCLGYVPAGFVRVHTAVAAVVRSGGCYAVVQHGEMVHSCSMKCWALGACGKEL